jgi:ABC-2 type transport system permease protein
MAVYRRGYQRYTGERTSHMTRLLVMPRFTWERLMQQKLVTILLLVAMFWPLVCSLFIYLANNLEILNSFGPRASEGLSRMIEVNGRFFRIFMNVQSVFALLLAALAGPGLVAPDLANNALPLYFSRPLTRGDYILTRLIVLAGLLSIVTLVPGLALFGMQSGMAGWDWFASNWWLGTGILTGFLLWIAMVSLVALASSAYVKWRIVAGALVLAFFILLAGAAEMTNGILRVEWATLFNPSKSLYTIWGELLGQEPPEEGPQAWECALAVAAMMGGLLAVLARKLRPVEVVK